MKRVAIISTILANYRYGIANLLSKQDNVKYKFYTSKKTHSGIKTINFNKSESPPEEGGISWKPVKNVYFKNICIWQRGVFKVGVSKKYDTLILLGNMYCVSTWFNAIIGRLTNKHVIMWTHGLKGGDLGLKLYFRSIFYKLAHDLFLYENRGKKLLINEGFAEDNLHVIYNSLDYFSHLKLRGTIKIDDFKKTKKKLFNNDNPLIVYSGRLVDSKKVIQIFKALSVLKSKNINCLIIGDGSERDNLENFVEENNLSNVVFYGSCYDESKLAKLIGMADVLVSPGNVGLAVVHAFSFGTPVISHSNLVTQMPEVEIIDEYQNGILFEEDNIEDLKNKINYWLDYSKDKRDNIRNKCYTKIDQFYNPNYQVKVFNEIVNRGILKKK